MDNGPDAPIRILPRPISPAAGASPPRPARALPAQPRARLFVPSRAWGGRRRREILAAAAVIAVLFHVGLALFLWQAPHFWPKALQPPPPPQASSPPDPPTIEMVVDKNKYAGGSTPTPPANPTPPAPDQPKAPPAPQPEAQKQPDVPQSVLPSPEHVDVPPPAPPEEKTAAASPPSPPPQPVSQPQVDLDQADGLGYGEQDDPHIIPASPDDKRANKMPPYPRAAGRRGEEGSVEMLVMLAADGRVTSVEVAVSSGHPDLDQTAQNAVSHWHFRPAMRNGVAVPTQMMQVFNFKIDRGGFGAAHENN